MVIQKYADAVKLSAAIQEQFPYGYSIGVKGTRKDGYVVTVRPAHGNDGEVSFYEALEKTGILESEHIDYKSHAQQADHSPENGNGVSR